MKETFDFSKVETSKSVNYLRPGQYKLGITETKYVKPTDKKPDGSPKTPYLEFTFSGAAGETTQKFYVTVKAFERIQNLHMYWFENKCDKVFDSVDAIGAYFEKLFNHEKAKKIVRNVVIGGRQANDGKVYAEIGFRAFVLPDTDDFEEKEYAPGTPDYIYHVKVAAPTPATNSNEVMLGMFESKPNNANVQVQDNFNDLPF